MSAIFGKSAFDGTPISTQELEPARPLLAPYGPDAETIFSDGSVAILLRTFHTTRESRCEARPVRLQSGSVLAWDGRIDNRAELIGQMKDELSAEDSDVSIAAAAYGRWGTGAFARLVGDWALSVWDAKQRSLVLARDFLGTRPLYYAVEAEQVTWSTLLGPLVLLAGRPLALEEEYLAGWLSFYPACSLTPYQGIHAVAPASFVRLASGAQTRSTYWDFDPRRQIHYPTDGEYEEHFRFVFQQAVQRRLRSDSPVLAELSGGMDSSSIVCMADVLIGRGHAETPRLDTISYFDDSEPNWNERPFVAAVEKKRGRAGCHLTVEAQPSLPLQLVPGDFAAVPGGGETSDAARQFARCLGSGGNRVLLSGLGGDEVTGGVPTAETELADLLVRGNFARLAQQIGAWALSQRKPWFHLLLATVAEFLPSRSGYRARSTPQVSWLEPAFAQRYRKALNGYDSRLSPFGPRPSFQENLRTLNTLRRQWGCRVQGAQPLCERRYPYLDRDLLEFLYAVPREQLLRPGQRRSLLRRTLISIVPDEILNRKRKGYLARSPLLAIAAASPQLLELSHNMVTAELGLVNPTAFIHAMQRAGHGLEFPFVPWMRTLALELWLRDLRHRSLLL